MQHINKFFVPKGFDGRDAFIGSLVKNCVNVRPPSKRNPRELVAADIGGAAVA